MSDNPDSTGRYRGHITIDGVRHERRHPDRAVVLAEISALAQRAAEGRTPPKRDPTLGDWISEWIGQRNATGRLRATTVASGYEPLARLHIIPRLGRIRLSRLTPGHLEQLYAELLTRKRQVERGGKMVTLPPLAPQTVLNVHRLLHAALKTAERRGYILRNPAELAEPPLARDPVIRELDPRAVAAILRTAAGADCEALLWLAVGAGLRQGELFALRRPDLDLDRGRLTVRERVRRITGVGLDVDAPKTTRGVRTIALPAITVAALRAHLTAQGTTPRRRGRGGLVVRDLVFPNQAGGYLEPQNWNRRVWRPLLKAAGVDERIPFRELTRKAQASLMVSLGIDPEALRKRMGHRDIETTFRFYTLAVTGADAQAAAAYDRALRALLADPAQDRGTERGTGDSQFPRGASTDQEGAASEPHG